MSAQILRTHTPAELALSEAFKAAAPCLPGGKSAGSLRDAAFAAFSAAGLPHRRLEDWHYTDLRHAMREALPLAAAPDAAALARVRARLAAEPMSGCRLVLVDGSFVADLSSPLPHGVAMRSLSDVLADVDADTMERATSRCAGSGRRRTTFGSFCCRPLTLRRDFRWRRSLARSLARALVHLTTTMRADLERAPFKFVFLQMALRLVVCYRSKARERARAIDERR